jgi:D-3-phosphoglycerate dehydrogenase / 2-oxoglutarate reductase
MEATMFSIQTLNKISVKGLQKLPLDNYETASAMTQPDAIVLRSFNMHDMELPSSLLAVARAGAGTNNIPIEKCTEQGIVVFNTPGANANGVKELVIAGLLLTSRRINEGMEWAQTLRGKGDEVPKLVEKGKSQFVGPEIFGKNLAVIGLGAIGVMVANAAVGLGMEVTGFDPFISVEAAWGLSREVKRAEGLEKLLSEADYITLHTPVTDATRGMLNKIRFTLMKRGVKILNFARGGLINNEDLIEACRNGIVDRYITDFPSEELLGVEQVLTVPHLGASTPEAEDNCAVMAVTQLRDFLEKGNIKNSVNFPDCRLDGNGDTRILIANKNVPNMVGQISTTLADAKINILDLLNKHRGNIAYNIIDIEDSIDDSVLEKLKSIEGVLMVRIIK